MSGNTERNAEMDVLLKRLEEIGGVTSSLWDEKHRIEAQIKNLKTEMLRESRFFSAFRWTIRLRETLGNHMHLEADEADVDRYDTELKYYFDDWNLRCNIYVFPDGRAVDHYYNRDDGVFSIHMKLHEITPEEYCTAFEEIGIEISFEAVEASIAEQRETLRKHEELIERFR